MMRKLKTFLFGWFNFTNRNCRNCHHWHDTGWDGKGIGVGKCINPKTIKQVKTMTEDHLLPFVWGYTEREKKNHARMIAGSMRFNSEFGCNNFEKNK